LLLGFTVTLSEANNLASVFGLSTRQVTNGAQRHPFAVHFPQAVM
jgi:hypothetical protein